MKTLIKLLAIVVVALFSLATICEAKKSENLRHDLENSYKDFTTAIKSKNDEMLKYSTTSYLYYGARNGLISSKSKFPENFFDSYVIDDMSTFHFIATIQKGATANLVYFGESGDSFTSKGVPYKVFRVIKFIKEDGSWKHNGILEFFDDIFVYSPNSSEEENIKYLQSTDAMPDGIIQPTPKLCLQPDYVAIVIVTANDVDAIVNINGYDYEKNINEYSSMSHLVFGGLKEGANTVTIHSTPIENATEPTLSVSIRASVDSGSDTIEVYNYERILGENEFHKTIFISNDLFKNIASP